MSDKYALVTGASTGIGKAVAKELSKSGYYVFLLGRLSDRLSNTKTEINSSGGKSEVIAGDLTNIDSLNALEALINQKTSQLDLIANIAGIWHGTNEVYAGKDFETFDEKVIFDTMSVGIISPMLLVRKFVSMMPKGSSIINLSGTFENGGKGWLPYYVSKRAIEDFTVGLSEELKDKNINVNCISPSDTATSEYKRFFPEDAADAQTPEHVAKKFMEILNKDESGKVYVVKNGKMSDGFHK